jgi:hypothetical protein
LEEVSMALTMQVIQDKMYSESVAKGCPMSFTR